MAESTASKLDANDLKILRILQEDADVSMQDLAEKVGLSHTPCWRRVSRMKDEGVIIGKRMIIDGERVGKGVNVLCTVELEHHHEDILENFEKAVQNCPEIIECFMMSGSRDYLLRIAVGSIAEYEKFMKQTLLHLPGVDTVDTSFALKQVKVTTCLPI
ncbi:MAG: Lrp/AsnC family transcriptional regulator [Rhodospirillaceae bacterium]|nr:Lrp/AsnC family transcriptional regulator [Rhodospirillaceae bacterium]